MTAKNVFLKVGTTNVAKCVFQIECYNVCIKRYKVFFTKILLQSVVHLAKCVLSVVRCITGTFANLVYKCVY